METLRKENEAAQLRIAQLEESGERQRQQIAALESELARLRAEVARAPTAAARASAEPSLSAPPPLDLQRCVSPEPAMSGPMSPPGYVARLRLFSRRFSQAQGFIGAIAGTSREVQAAAATVRRR
jgi:hypothetical protein